jgi:hypothetical protein
LRTPSLLKKLERPKPVALSTVVVLSLIAASASSLYYHVGMNAKVCYPRLFFTGIEITAPSRKIIVFWPSRPMLLTNYEDIIARFVVGFLQATEQRREEKEGITPI